MLNHAKSDFDVIFSGVDFEIEKSDKTLESNKIKRKSRY